MKLTPTSVWISVAVITIAVTHAAKQDGRWCFECGDMSNPAECGHVRKCETDQQCYAEKFDTSMGYPKYNSGCEDDSVCQKYSRRGYYIHQVGDVIVCKSCCNDTDGCNGQLCHASALDKSGKVCFSCMGTSSPDRCQSVTMCKGNEMCAWTKRKSVFYDVQVYDMGCLTSSECQQKNETYCCSGDFCNSKKEFECGNGRSIPMYKQCDNFDDCPNGTDEVNCPVPIAG